MKNIFWIGIRESDIHYAKELFKGAILLFGEKKEYYYVFNEYRANQNYFNDNIRNFFISSAYDIIANFPNCKFMLYNQKMLDFLPSEVKQRTLFYVDRNIRRTLSDKISSRHLLNDIILSPPYIELLGCDISFDRLKDAFPDCETFLVQDRWSGGGSGSFIFDSTSQNEVMHFIDRDKLYLISIYLNNTQSVNVHVLISEKKVKIYPASIQIIGRDGYTFRYIGADFKAYSSLPEVMQKNIEHNSKIIVDRLLNMGYQGVFGIDYLLCGDKLYFCEINTRFQGSTMWLDCLLTKNKINSIFHDYINGIVEEKIQIEDRNVSGLLYYGSNTNLKSFYKICRVNTNLCEVFDDGYTQFDKVDENSYLFRVTFFKNISWKPIYESTRIFENLNPYNFEICHQAKLKIMLLSCGIRIPDIYNPAFNLLKEGVFSSFDLMLSDGTCVNAPYKLDFSEFSPFSLNAADKGYYLSFYDQWLDSVSVELCSPAIYNQRTATGRSLSDIFYLATDRIRIRIQGGCDLKTLDVGCKFCNVPKGSIKYNEKDIIENLEVIEKNINFNHYMIGGGSDLTDESWQKIINITRAIKGLSNKEITLMCIAPKNKDTMVQLKQAGIDDVSFNLEICSDELAKRLMPYKGMPRNEYFQRLRNAVNVWGKFNVRSMLLVGLEPEEILYETIEKLCVNGIQPVLSVFRPLCGSELSNGVPLDSEKLYNIYLKATQICQKFGTYPGPRCQSCKNNTLSY